jgi:uncharacterized SAM-binding protein YcdF (DUF218 family)
VNDVLAALGLLEWKPLASALLLPPLALLLLLAAGLLALRRAPVLGRVMVAGSLLSMWFSQCEAVGGWMESQLAAPYPAVSPQMLAEWQHTLAGQRPVIVVLGGGREALAPEYGTADLDGRSLQRLRYGLWLARQLHQVPVLFSGGAGLAARDGASEAEIARRVAERDFGQRLRWLETESRDTRENARYSLNQLKREGVTDVLLVTHGWHMRRALRAFEDETQRQGLALRILPAPMGLAAPDTEVWRQWLPSAEGQVRVQRSLREHLGRWFGA